MGVNTAEMLEKSIKKQILYKLLYEALKFENEGKELKDFILYIETMIDNE